MSRFDLFLLKTFLMKEYTNTLGTSSIENHAKHNLVFIATPDTLERVEKISGHLTEALGEEPQIISMPFKKFNNGGWNVVIQESIRDKVVYVYSDVESNYAPSGETFDAESRYMLSRKLINAAKNAGAASVNVIYPSFPDARSDKPEKSGRSESSKRVPAGAAMVTEDLKRAGADYVMMFDIHNTAILSHFA
jgi:phosphoribosylpyrophosphate synthetase